jgi:O-antigen/teichoic acid export membrane protein
VSAIAKKSLETFVVRGLSLASALVLGIVIARLLGPYGKGLYTYVIVVLTLMTTLAAGQGSAIAWQLVKGRQPPREVYAALLRTVAVFAIPTATVLIAIAVAVPSQRVLLPVAAALPFALYGALVNGFFLSASDVRSGNIQTLVLALVSLLSVPVLFLHGGLGGVLIVWVASYVAAAVTSIIRMRPYLAGPTAEKSEYPFKQQLLFGIKTALNALVEELNIRIDIFLVLLILGAGALGVYSLGIGIASLLWQLSRPIATAAFGRIGSSSEADSAALTARCMRHSLAFVAAAAAIAFVVGPMLIVPIYGAPFAAAGNVLRMLLPGIVAYCLMPLLATFFTQQLGRPSIPLALSAISTVLCAAATAALLPRYGIIAGAAATSASYVTAVAIGAALFVRRTGISPIALFILNGDDVHRYVQLFTAAATRVRRLGHVSAR